MLSLVSGFFGGVSNKVLMIGAGVLAVGLVLLGAYKKGQKVQRYREQAATLHQVKRNLRVKERTQREIQDARNDDGSRMSAAEQLRRSPWVRPGGAERL